MPSLSTITDLIYVVSCGDAIIAACRYATDAAALICQNPYLPHTVRLDPDGPVLYEHSKRPTSVESLGSAERSHMARMIARRAGDVLANRHSEAVREEVANTPVKYLEEVPGLDRDTEARR